MAIMKINFSVMAIFMSIFKKGGGFKKYAFWHYKNTCKNSTKIYGQEFLGSTIMNLYVLGS